MKASQFILTGLAVIAIAFTKAEKCQPAARPGLPYQVQFSFHPNRTTAVQRLAWNLVTSDGTVLLAVCYLESGCNDAFPAMYNAELTKGDDGMEHVSLTILSVTREMAGKSFQWFVDPDTNGACDLQVNSFPMPKCEKPDQSLESITVNCNITNDQPTWSCDFYRSVDNGQVILIDGQQSSTISSCPSSDHCVHQCKLDMKMATLGAGHHRFRVSDVFGHSNWTAAIHLFYPRAGTVHCPNGFIKDGNTETCECVLLAQGNPPGRVRWMSANGTEVGSPSNETSSLLYLSFRGIGANPESYYCEGVSSLGHNDTDSQTYTPKFAYGPEEVTEFIVPSVFNVCHHPNNNNNNNNNNITAVCKLDKDTVNPEPNVSMKVPGQPNLLPNDRSQQSGRYVYSFSFQPGQDVNESSVIAVQCVASNSKFPELRTQTAIREIAVQKPPDLSPQIAVQGQAPITDGQRVDVPEGQTVQVECSVEGGSPPVNLTSLKCGNDRTSTAQPRMTLFRVLSRDHSNEKCVCSAEHSTGCYDKTTSVVFNVLFGPDTVKTTMNATVVTLCPSGGGAIVVFCDVPVHQANPRPKVVLECLGHVVQPDNETQESGNYRSEFLLTPKTGGIFTVTCRASNPAVPSVTAKNSIMITVIEPPTSSPALSIGSVPDSVIQSGQLVNVTANRGYDVQCDVLGGFPPVTKVIMTCAGLQFEENGPVVTRGIALKSTIDDRKTCLCRAEHSSGCYNLTSVLTFNVQYPSQITNFTVLSSMQQVMAENSSESTSQLEVAAGTRITLVCEAEGNPQTDVTLKGSNNNKSIPSQMTSPGDHVTRAVASHWMGCRDTAFYKCEAYNGMKEPSLRTVLVLVLCTPELADPDNEYQTLTRSKGVDLEIKIRIVGHPHPKKYSLTRIATRAKRSTDIEEVESDREVELDRYRTTFTRVDELIGQVTLTMFDVTESDNGRYELTIQNGIGDGLNYSFSVQVAEGEETESPPSTGITESNTGSSGDDIGLVIGGIVAAAVVVIVVVALFFLWKCRRDRDQRNKNRGILDSGLNVGSNNGKSEDFKADNLPKMTHVALRDVKSGRAHPNAGRTSNVTDGSSDITEYAEIDDFAVENEYVDPDDIIKGEIEENDVENGYLYPTAIKEAELEKKSVENDYLHPVNISEGEARKKAGGNYDNSLDDYVRISQPMRESDYVTPDNQHYETPNAVYKQRFSTSRNPDKKTSGYMNTAAFEVDTLEK